MNIDRDGVAGDDLHTALAQWLIHERGIVGERRIVSVDASRILLSRFDDGFFARLQRSLAARPALFDRDVVARRYDAVARAHPAMLRVDAWHEAMRQLVTGDEDVEPLTSDQQAEVLAGVDSVAAVMQAVLWTAPLAGEPYTPHPGERAACGEVSGRFRDGHDLFTRDYGSFAGRRVVTFCPGVAWARRLLALAWSVCTGTPPPEPDGL